MMSALHRILLIDDEAAVRFGVRDFLETQGFAVDEAGDCQAAQKAFEANRPDAVILDFSLPDGDSLELMSRLKEMDANIAVLILTAHGSIDLAVRAIKEGADQFLTKPVNLQSLLILIRREIDRRRNRQKRLAHQNREVRSGALDPFAGTSIAIRKLEEQARRVVVSDSTVLITGETGTGKGVLARWLHDNGPRAAEPFVDLNCAGFSGELLTTELFGHEKGAFTGAVSAKQGLLEIGDRGTVFLDEIGDMDSQIQPKLLKVLDEKRFRRVGEVKDRRVDIRLIAATNQDLGRLVHENKFRSDLYYRINTIPLMLPPLRERKEDIPVLAPRILKKIADDLGRKNVTLSAEADVALRQYSWPGNVRELRNVLERAVLLSPRQELLPQDLHFEDARSSDGAVCDSNLTLAELERQHIERVLAEEDGRVERAAARLGLARSSLYHKIKQYGLLPSKS
jgi:DNA-binding NtrC family response regulator